MALTMHSHSGEFCPGHARDELRAIVAHAASLGFETVALTEHMPRLSAADLYPEELEAEEASKPARCSSSDSGAAAAALAKLAPRHEAFLREAVRLRSEYEDGTTTAESSGKGKPLRILIGFESEFIRPAAYAPYLRRLAADPRVDFWIGSLHHVRGVPIDFDRAMYARAIATVRKGVWGCASRVDGSSGGEEDGEWVDEAPPLLGTDDDDDNDGDGERALFEAYYDEQHALLRDLRPRVVGHFDLVRLFSARPDADVRTAWGPGVWARVLRNLRCAREAGAWLECNSSALRKGLREPYPSRAVAEAWLEMGGSFTLSDDSHGIAQVATNYVATLSYLEDLGVTEVWTLERVPVETVADNAAAVPGHGNGHPPRKMILKEKAVPLTDIRRSFP